MRSSTGIRVAMLLVVSVAWTGCGSSKPAKTVTVTTAANAQVTAASRIRLEAFASVAQRIYTQEAGGGVNQKPIRTVRNDAALIRAVSRGDPKAARAEAQRQITSGPHITGVRITKRSRELASVGLPFIMPGKARDLRGPGGTLGQIQISVQDVLGYVSLIRRQTGADVVVRGSYGHVKSTLPAAATSNLPRSGTVTLAGRRYDVISFQKPGWAGEQLTIWMLDPA